MLEINVFQEHIFNKKNPYSTPTTSRLMSRRGQCSDTMPVKNDKVGDLFDVKKKRAKRQLEAIGSACRRACACVHAWVCISCARVCVCI